MKHKLESRLLGEISITLDSDAGRDWGQKEKGTTEDEMGGAIRRMELFVGGLG